MLTAKPANTQRILACASAMLLDINAINIPGAITHIEAFAIGGIVTLKPAMVNCITISVTTTQNLLATNVCVID